ncbi:MAG: adenosylmethionine decarboxylase [Thermoanaerobaculia bacterium]|nr:adenosylmethionine decarboxylase [Thermoanaerobaculia bacterium]
MDRQDLRLGRHLLVDAWGAPADRLDDPDLVGAAAAKGVEAAGATLVNLTVHQFSPQGVTAVATLAESHLALHTWPEHGFFGLDIFLCGELRAGSAIEEVCRLLGAADHRVQELERSMPRG